MRTMKLAPSVFGAGIGNLSQQLKILEENNVELLHVDVMDGHFVEKMAFGPDHIKMLKELTTIPLDVHLMIEKPERKLIRSLMPEQISLQFIRNQQQDFTAVLKRSKAVV